MSKKKKQVRVTFIVILILGMIMFNGCKDNGFNKENNMGKIDLTDDEKRVLKDIFIDEDRICKGELLDYQIRCLEQIRYSEKYLKRKYNNDFYIVSYEQISKLNSVGRMHFRKEDESDIYELILEKDNDGYMARDNYYNRIIQDKYDDYLKSLIIEETGINCLTDTEFKSLMGEEADSNLSIDKVLELGNELSRHTYIYIKEYGISENDIEIILKKFMLENNLYGSYTVCLGDEEQNIKQIRFNCFY